MNLSNLRIDSDRPWQSLMDMAIIGVSPGGGGPGPTGRLPSREAPMRKSHLRHSPGNCAAAAVRSSSQALSVWR